MTDAEFDELVEKLSLFGDRDADREMSPAEFEQALREPPPGDISDEQIQQLIEWFTRKYPTPEERLAYVRRKVKALRKRHGDSVIAHLRSVKTSNDLTTDEVMETMRGKPAE